MAARRVFLHIGAPKTGTTYLQGVAGPQPGRPRPSGCPLRHGRSSRDRVWATEELRGIDLSRHPRPRAAGAWDRIVEQVQGLATAPRSCPTSSSGHARRSRPSGRCRTSRRARCTSCSRRGTTLSLASAVWQERLKYGHATRSPTSGSTPPTRRRCGPGRRRTSSPSSARWQHDLPALAGTRRHGPAGRQARRPVAAVRLRGRDRRRRSPPRTSSSANTSLGPRGGRAPAPGRRTGRRGALGPAGARTVDPGPARQHGALAGIRRAVRCLRPLRPGARGPLPRDGRRHRRGRLRRRRLARRPAAAGPAARDPHPRRRLHRGAAGRGDGHDRGAHRRWSRTAGLRHAG